MIASSRRDRLASVFAFTMLLFPDSVAASAAGPMEIDRILRNPERDDAQTVAGIVLAGPAAVRKLYADQRESTLPESDRARLTCILRRARARLMGVTSAHVAALDELLAYEGGWGAENANLVLGEILQDGARDSDYGRAEVLRALLHVYQVIHELPVAERSTYKPSHLPRDLLSLIVPQPAGSEEARVLERSLHLLLFHDWISHFGGAPRMVIRLFESPHLPPEVYRWAHGAMLKALSQDCQPWSHWRQLDERRRPRLLESDRDNWPCLPDWMFIVLWDSPAATEAERLQLHNALLELLLCHEAKESVRYDWSKYYGWLRDSGWVQPEHICSFIDRALRDELFTSSAGQAMFRRLFPDVYEACPQWRSEDSGPRWEQLKAWWFAGGREAEWMPALKHPMTAHVFLVVATDGEELTLTSSSVPLTSRRMATVDCPTQEATIRFDLLAWPSPRREGVTLLAMRRRQLEENRPTSPGTDRPYARDLPSPVPAVNHVWAELSEGLVYRQEAPNLPGMVIVCIEDSVTPFAAFPDDLETLFDLLRHRLPFDTAVYVGFPGRNDEWLPMRYRLLLADRFLDTVNEPTYRHEWRRSSTHYERFSRIARFASAAGDPYARKALQKWIDRQWPRSDLMQQVLRDCDRLLLAARGGCQAPVLIDLLERGQQEDDVLSTLLRADVRAGLADAEKKRIACLLARARLASCDRSGRRFVLICLLRELTGEYFGYEPFGSEQKKAQAVREWVGWADRHDCQL